MHKIFQTKRYGFTIVELMFVMVIIGLIVPSMFSLYGFIIRAYKEINARHEAIHHGYEFLEKLNVLMQDYTVDYEEYYNRQMVGCVEGGGTGSAFTWNVGLSGYCTEFTAYGNKNSTKRNLGSSQTIDDEWHEIYYCSSTRSTATNEEPLGPKVVQKESCGNEGTRQSFGQYAALFLNVGGDTDQPKDGNLVGDSDDKNLGMPIKDQGATAITDKLHAIEDPENIQELYLISHDGKTRLYFRRKLVRMKDNHVQYKIQMLRLRGFDAGRQHDFSITNKSNEGLYDGKIDTWACDASMGFIGNGASIDQVGGTYADYRLPKDENDCWIDLTHGSTTVSSRNIAISPTNDSDLYRSDQDLQINAYMKLFIINSIYPPYYGTLADSAAEFKVPLETIINMKDFYRN